MSSRGPLKALLAHAASNALAPLLVVSPEISTTWIAGSLAEVFGRASKMPCVSPLALTFLYAIGAGMIAGGIYVIAHSAFPGWVRGTLLWPLITVTPAIATMQGWAAICFGIAVLAYGFDPFAPPIAFRGLLVLAGSAAMAGTLLFAYSTWLSRQPQQGSVPPRH